MKFLLLTIIVLIKISSHIKLDFVERMPPAGVYAKRTVNLNNYRLKWE